MKMKMNIVPNSYAINVALLALLLPLCSCDLIDDTCKKTPNPNLCTSILRSNPKSKGADVTGLALVGVDTVKSSSTSTIQTISQLLKTNPGLKVPLNECSDHYKFILDHDVTTANEALTKGNPKFAEESMNDAGSEIQRCEDGFKSFGTSPLTAKNKENRDISAIASAIIKQLL